VADGLYDVRAITTDNAGNTATSATVTNRRIDNTAPTAGMTNPGSPIQGTFTFNGTGTDAGSGVASVAFQISPIGLNTWSTMCSDTTSPYSCAYDTTLKTDGQYDYRALVTDVAGNTATSTVFAGGYIDNGFPTVSVNNPGILHGTVTISVTASDGTGTGILNVQLQGSPGGAGAWGAVCTDTTAPYSCTYDTTTVPDGLYDLRAIATDNASHATTSAVLANVRVDNTAPTAGMTDPGTPLHGTVTLNATGTDGGSGVANVTIQRSPAGAGTWTDVCADTNSPYSCSLDTTTLTDGLYDFRAVTTDNGGLITYSTTVTNRRIDNTAPTANLTNPGSPLTGTVTLNATSTDTGGSGVFNVVFQRSPAGAGTWTTICTDATSPYSCSFNTTTVTDGLYDLRALATDNATNTATSVVTSRVIDNDTTPTGADIQTTNGGTGGRVDAGDTVIFTYTEQMQSTSILAGWNGTSTAVVLRINQNGTNDTLEVRNSGNTATLPLTLAGNPAQLHQTYITATSTWNATMVQNGATITITVGTFIGGTLLTNSTPAAITWRPSGTATDLNGHPCGTGMITESGGSDVDF
jgi:hypothetical protein